MNQPVPIQLCRTYSVKGSFSCVVIWRRLPRLTPFISNPSECGRGFGWHVEWVCQRRSPGCHADCGTNPSHLLVTRIRFCRGQIQGPISPRFWHAIFASAVLHGLDQFILITSKQPNSLPLTTIAWSLVTQRASCGILARSFHLNRQNGAINSDSRLADSRRRGFCAADPGVSRCKRRPRLRSGPHLCTTARYGSTEESRCFRSRRGRNRKFQNVWLHYRLSVAPLEVVVGFGPSPCSHKRFPQISGAWRMPY